MDFNVGTLMYDVLKLLVDIPRKLYDILYYQVDISWINKLLDFFGSDPGLPNSISLISIVGTISAAALVGIIIYNIFKL